MKKIKKQLEKLRTDLNKLRKLDVFCDTQQIEQTQYTIVATIHKMRLVFNVSPTTICSLLQINRRTLTKAVAPYTVFRAKKKTQNSYLVDRVHYARLICDSVLTVKDVVKSTGYCDVTIYNWVRDYKKFRNKMLSQAIAFRRSL